MRRQYKNIRRSEPATFIKDKAPLRNRIIIKIILLLSKFMKPNTDGIRVRYWNQGFEENYIDLVDFDLSYILTCHENNRNVTWECTEDKNFRVQINITR